VAVPTNKAESAPGAKLRCELRNLTARYAALKQSEADAYTWKQLHYEALRTYVVGQRAFLSVHSSVVSDLREDLQPDRRKRSDSLELFTGLNDLYQLVRSIVTRIGLSS
jgi:hypothetical protein